MKIVVVSPHFDDGVLSCWTLIDGPADVTVLTVFTEGPGRPGFVAEWDADTGVDSSTRMEQRAEENRAALSLASRRPADLGGLEGIYGGGSVDPEELRPHLARADAVYIPAGVGIEHVNREHVVVRDACLSVRGDCRFYADQPYSLFRDDTELPPGLAPGAARRIMMLDDDQRSRKARAIACYAGDVGKLESAFGSITEPERLPHEVFWYQGAASEEEVRA
jgi:hypothetical protein